MQMLYRSAGLIVEPSAALGIAALLEDPPRYTGKRVATIICGGNVIPTDFERWMAQQRERMMRAAGKVAKRLRTCTNRAGHSQ
jgi:threonine dehydratase